MGTSTTAVIFLLLSIRHVTSHDDVIKSPPPQTTVAVIGGILTLTCVVDTEEGVQYKDVYWEMEVQGLGKAEEESEYTPICTYTKSSNVAEDEPRPVPCDGDKRFSYDTGNLFTITSSSAVDQTFNGKYRCGWTAKEGRTVDYDTQVVIVVIEEVTCGESLKVVQGEDVLLKCSVPHLSTETPTIEWTVNDEQQSGTKYTKTNSKYVFTSENEIVVKNVQKETTCVCTIKETVVPRDQCTVKVATGTLLKPKGGEVLVKEGQESNITCEEAASTCPEGEDGRQRCRKESVIKYKGVTWYRNILPDSEKQLCAPYKEGDSYCSEGFKVDTDQKFNLAIGNVSMELAGVYKCCVSPLSATEEGCNELEHVAKQLIVWNSTIDSCPSDNVAVGTKAKLSCEVNYKSNSTMTLALNLRESISPSEDENGQFGNLSISKDMSGLAVGKHVYTCSLTVKKTNVTVDVCSGTVGIGIIESPPTDQYAWANEKTELACTLSKDVETTTYDSVTWKNTEKKVCSSGPSHYNSDSQCDDGFVMDDGQKHDLSILNVTFDLADVYQCIPTLKDGKEHAPKSFEASLSVLGKPVCDVDDPNPVINKDVTLSCSVTYALGSPTTTPPEISWPDVSSNDGTSVVMYYTTTSGDLTTITSQEVITASKMGEHTLTCEVTADKESESCEVRYSIGLVQVGARPLKHQVEKLNAKKKTLPCSLVKGSTAEHYEMLEWTQDGNQDHVCTGKPDKKDNKCTDGFSLSTDRPHDLIIDEVHYSHGGVFYCKVMPKVKDELTDWSEEYNTTMIVKGPTECDAAKAVYKGHIVYATCWSSYTGPVAPTMSLSDADGNNMLCGEQQISAMDDHKLVSTRCIVPGTMLGEHRYQCKALFEGINWEDSACVVTITVSEQEQNPSEAPLLDSPGGVHLGCFGVLLILHGYVW